MAKAPRCTRGCSAVLGRRAALSPYELHLIAFIVRCSCSAARRRAASFSSTAPWTSSRAIRSPSASATSAGSSEVPGPPATLARRRPRGPLGPRQRRRPPTVRDPPPRLPGGPRAARPLGAAGRGVRRRAHIDLGASLLRAWGSSRIGRDVGRGRPPGCAGFSRRWTRRAGLRRCRRSACCVARRR